MGNNRGTVDGMAPVVVFVYKRATHTENLLLSLSGCDGAKETEVYIYSDGPKKPTDEAGVQEVRKIIHEERWQQAFKTVNICESPKNKGLANSIIGGATEIINKYGKVLVLEDDLIVAPYYITYMNQALNAFENKKDIFAVAGWSYPVKCLKNYQKDAWLHYRPCSWGWGTWKDRWEKVVWDAKEARYSEKLLDKKWCANFAKAGNDLAPMLRRQINGEIDSWAIRWTAAMREMDMLAVFPTHPVVYDDGRDGSGTHAHADGVDRLQEAEPNKGKEEQLTKFISDTFADGKATYDFTDVCLDKRIVRAAWNYDSDTFVKKVKRNIKKRILDKISS